MIPERGLLWQQFCTHPATSGALPPSAFWSCKKNVFKTEMDTYRTALTQECGK
jgi:hypothetical protein